ncbi:uncharacterized protein LOC123869491 isoform X38 [Maniola jurtina]|uniref:uncharacterized protein LOC123869491 isoform X38 n=1 Tax=Maniola jurtina TaxID=191418 RepID=UPI001E68D0F4|nr:uncharacterized protein LOC123869491 isoform X38 [Maniola jurtina]
MQPQFLSLMTARLLNLNLNRRPVILKNQPLLNLHLNRRPVILKNQPLLNLHKITPAVDLLMQLQQPTLPLQATAQLLQPQFLSLMTAHLLNLNHLQLNRRPVILKNQPLLNLHLNRRPVILKNQPLLNLHKITPAVDLLMQLQQPTLPLQATAQLLQPQFLSLLPTLPARLLDLDLLPTLPARFLDLNLTTLHARLLDLNLPILPARLLYLNKITPAVDLLMQLQQPTLPLQATAQLLQPQFLSLLPTLPARLLDLDLLPTLPARLLDLNLTTLHARLLDLNLPILPARLLYLNKITPAVDLLMQLQQPTLPLQATAQLLQPQFLSLLPTLPARLLDLDLLPTLPARLLDLNLTTLHARLLDLNLPILPARLLYLNKITPAVDLLMQLQQPTLPLQATAQLLQPQFLSLLPTLPARLLDLDLLPTLPARFLDLNLTTLHARLLDLNLPILPARLLYLNKITPAVDLLMQLQQPTLPLQATAQLLQPQFLSLLPTLPARLLDLDLLPTLPARLLDLNLTTLHARLLDLNLPILPARLLYLNKITPAVDLLMQLQQPTLPLQATAQLLQPQFLSLLPTLPARLLDLDLLPTLPARLLDLNLTTLHARLLDLNLPILPARLLYLNKITPAVDLLMQLQQPTLPLQATAQLLQPQFLSLLPTLPARLLDLDLLPTLPARFLDLNLTTLHARLLDLNLPILPARLLYLNKITPAVDLLMQLQQPTLPLQATAQLLQPQFLSLLPTLPARLLDLDLLPTLPARFLDLNLTTLHARLLDLNLPILPARLLYLNKITPAVDLLMQLQQPTLPLQATAQLLQPQFLSLLPTLPARLLDLDLLPTLPARLLDLNLTTLHARLLDLNLPILPARLLYLNKITPAVDLLMQLQQPTLPLQATAQLLQPQFLSLLPTLPARLLDLDLLPTLPARFLDLNLPILPARLLYLNKITPAVDLLMQLQQPTLPLQATAQLLQPQFLSLLPTLPARLLDLDLLPTLPARLLDLNLTTLHARLLDLNLPILPARLLYLNKITPAVDLLMQLQQPTLPLQATAQLLQPQFLSLLPTLPARLLDLDLLPTLAARLLDLNNPPPGLACALAD